MAKLWVIAGHGAGDCGACGGGETEEERVRALAARIKALGGNNVVVLDTSRDWYADGGVSSLSIPKGDMLIELHRDSATPASARGAHIIIKSGTTPDAFDWALVNGICTNILPGRSTKIEYRTNLANANRAYARGINYRLLECGFISNATDRKIFNEQIDTIAKSILDAAGVGSGGTWINCDGWWWYRHADGSCTKGGWEFIDGYWYLFDNDGWMCTGWNYRNGHWYYLDPSGRMLTGWQWIDGYCYCLADDGVMQTGWQNYYGTWYWCHADGHMAVNEWQKIDGEWYYLGSGGEAFCNGWYWIDGKCYYFYDNCVMAHDTYIGNYYVGSDGAWA